MMVKPFVRMLFAVVLMTVGFHSGLSAASDGQAVFDTLRCGSCHKPDKKTVGVSLAEIGKAYSSPEKLVAFFKGTSDPLIDTDKPGMMLGQKDKLKALPEGDQKALAGYILGFK